MLNGCGIGEWEIDELYALKIEGSSKILYKYSAFGGRDSMVAGYLILDSTETFEVDISNTLKFIAFLEIPNKHEIKVLDTDYNGIITEDYEKTKPIFHPLKSEIEDNEGINVTTYIYQYEGYIERASGSYDLDFEYFKETRDSIFFYNLNDLISMDPQHFDSLKVKKNNIFIRHDKNFCMKSIDIDNLIVDRKKQIVSSEKFHLTPKGKLKSDIFSNYGIFKEVPKILTGKGQ